MDPHEDSVQSQTSSFPPSTTSAQTFGDIPALRPIDSLGVSQLNAEHAPQVAGQSSLRMDVPYSHYIVFSVTGIERSNARNPIVRFDAKVVIRLWRWLILTDKSAAIPSASSPRYQTYSSRASQTSRPPDLCQSRMLCAGLATSSDLGGRGNGGR
jgi:hypothetical protein